MIELIVLGFGSNLGRRFDNLRKAIKLISQSNNFNLLAVSPVYETEPWGYKKQNNFLNCIAAGFYREDEHNLFRELKSVEKKLRRKKTEKWHPRNIDIDILFFGNRMVKSKRLKIPHPYIQYRNFILKPLCDLMPDFIHPVLGKSVRSLYNQSKDKCKVWLLKQRLV